MDEKTNPTRSIAIVSGLVAIGSVLAVIPLMPTALLLATSSVAIVPALAAVLRKSRVAALTADAILLATLLVSHFLGTSGATSGSLDILRLTLVISFQEFFALSTEVRSFDANYKLSESLGEDLSVIACARSAFAHRGLSVAGLIALTGGISEIFYLAAKGASASLYTIYGVAAGLIVLILFLFLLLSAVSTRPQT